MPRSGLPKFLRQLHDVVVGENEPSDGDGLVYDGASRKWRPGAGNGGSSAVITREEITGGSVAIADGATGTLTWDAVSGDALLDRSNLGTPTVIAAGVYAVSVQVYGSAMSLDGYFAAQLELDVQNDDATVLAYSPAATATLTGPSVVLPATYYITEGGEIRLEVTSHDGAATRSFTFRAIIQRLS